MPTTAVIGTQWGDEGKGRVADMLASDADLVVRYQGGSNAGHTVVVRSSEYRLHLVPSGILRPGTACLMADGMVIEPEVLSAELRELRELGVDTSALRLSGAAHVVMPYHRLLDGLDERRRGVAAIGTTTRGIGPAYADKAFRTGVRVYDLLEPDRLRAALSSALPRANAILEGLHGQAALTVDEVIERVSPYVPEIAPLVVDGRAMVFEALARGDRILLEGAQGTFLDLDYGTYPWVTSSHPVSAGACLGTGIGPRELDAVVGVAKAYTTRVGAGPFPAEAEDELGLALREAGREYGTTTGRPRRCGWFDACLVRTAVKLNSVTSLIITKLDVLDPFDTIKVVTAYDDRGRRLDYVPSDPMVFARCKPVCVELPGWGTPLTAMTSADELPPQALAYIRAIEELVGASVSAASVGPEREQTIWFGSPAATGPAARGRCGPPPASSW